MKTLNRRMVLAGFGGAAIALPWLEFTHGKANAQAADGPKRFALFFDHGGTLSATEVTAFAGVIATAVGWPRRQPLKISALTVSTQTQTRICPPARNVIAFCSDWQSTPPHAPQSRHL